MTDGLWSLVHGLREGLIAWLKVVFGEGQDVPFLLFGAMILAALAISLQAYLRHRPFMAAAQSRIAALRAAVGASGDPSLERASFAEQFIELDRAFSQTRGAHVLVMAWREFKEAVIDETETPIRNGHRPSAFFQRAVPHTGNLSFWSNVFVGLGLILTFLGLIVALVTAQGAIGGNTQEAQGALRGLLNTAAAKFFTSVGGLFGSLILRFAEHQIGRHVQRQVDEICTWLERGMLYVTPQQIAVQQLLALHEQRDQLKFFNTDVAIQLGDRIGVKFEQAIAPMAASLGHLNESMTSVTQGIGAGAREAIEKVSGDQLSALSQTLSGLTGKIERLGESINATGSDAAQQIRSAGADFASAAGEIRQAFAGLTGTVSSIGDKLAEQSQTAKSAQDKLLETTSVKLDAFQDAIRDSVASASDALARQNAELLARMRQEAATALAEELERNRTVLDAGSSAFSNSAGQVRSAFETLIGDIASLSQRIGEQADRTAAAQNERLQRLLESVEDVHGRSADAAKRAAEAMVEAGAETAERVNKAVLESLEQGLAQTRAEIQAAVDQAILTLRKSTSELNDSLMASSLTIRDAGAGFARSGEAAERTAVSMLSVSDRSRDAAQALDNASRNLNAVAQPLSASVSAVEKATTDLSRNLSAGLETQARALADMSKLAQGIEQTQRNADSAWSEYRKRFEDVDQAMSRTAKDMIKTLADSLELLKQHAEEAERLMAEAVSKFGTPISAIEGYAESLDEYANALRREKAEA